MPSERLVRSSESITEPSGELLGSFGGLVESSESMIGPLESGGLVRSSVSMIGPLEDWYNVL